MNIRNLVFKALCAAAAFLCTSCGLAYKFSISNEYNALYEPAYDEVDLIARHKEALQIFIRKELAKLIDEIEQMKEGILEEATMTLTELLSWREIYHQNELDSPQILFHINQAIDYLESRKQK